MKKGAWDALGNYHMKTENKRLYGHVTIKGVAKIVNQNQPRSILLLNRLTESLTNLGFIFKSFELFSNVFLRKTVSVLGKQFGKSPAPKQLREKRG